MSGASGDVQVVMFTFGLLAKGITAVEFDAAAGGMLSFVRSVHGPQLAGIIERGTVDIVGAGDDGADTVSISTMSTIVTAASGVPALERGNRAASSKSGGVDMLEAFGTDIEDGLVTSPEYPDFYVCLLFAVRFHPATRFAGPVHKELAAPTAFNPLGPLTNPTRSQASLTGCVLEDQMETMANIFVRRG